MLINIHISWGFLFLCDSLCWIQNKNAHTWAAVHISKLWFKFTLCNSHREWVRFTAMLDFFILGIFEKKNCCILRITYTLLAYELSSSQMSTYYLYIEYNTYENGLPCYSVSTKLSCRETVLDDFRGSHLLLTCRRPLIEALDTADMTEKPVC